MIRQAETEALKVRTDVVAVAGQQGEALADLQLAAIAEILRWLAAHPPLQTMTHGGGPASSLEDLPPIPDPSTHAQRP